MVSGVCDPVPVPLLARTVLVSAFRCLCVPVPVCPVSLGCEIWEVKAVVASASLSTEEYIIGSFILDVLAEALAGLLDALRLLLGIAAYTQYVNYICRCVLPLPWYSPGWYQMRRCERDKHLGIIKSLAFNRPHMRNQAGSPCLRPLYVSPLSCASPLSRPPRPHPRPKGVVLGIVLGREGMGGSGGRELPPPL